jgi:hypothetical protein
MTMLLTCFSTKHLVVHGTNIQPKLVHHHWVQAGELHRQKLNQNIFKFSLAIKHHYKK